MSQFLGPIHHWLFGKIQLQDKLVHSIIQFLEKKVEGKDEGNSNEMKVFLNVLKEELNGYGMLPVERLEDAIDVGNIHGWLQSCVSMVEYKLAVCITRIMENTKVFSIESTRKKNSGIKSSRIERNIIEEDVGAFDKGIEQDIEEVEDKNILEELQELFYEFGKGYGTCQKKNNLESIISAKEGYQLLQDMLLDGMPCDHANMVIETHGDYVIWRRNVCVHKEYYEEVNGDVAHFYRLRDELIRGIMYNSGIHYEVVDEGVYRLYTS